MRWYSRFRFVLLAAALGIVLYAGAGRIALAADAPPAAEETKYKAVSVNPFGLVMEHWNDWVLWIILGCSVAGVTFIVQGFIKARAAVVYPEATTTRIRELIGQKQFKELIEFTESDPSFVSQAMNAALKRAPSFPAMKEAMETSLGEQTADQFRRIEYLNIIGNLGPLLGLLGTVIGMINAFENMRRSGGELGPTVLAGGVAMALTHTMMGLLLALPCLAAFGILRTMVDRLTVRGSLIAEEMLLMIKPTEAKPAAVAAMAPKVAESKPIAAAKPAVAAQV